MLLAGPYTLQDVDLWRFGERADRERLHEGLRLAEVPKTGSGKAVSPTKVPGATTVDAVDAKSLFDRGVPFVDVRGRESWNDGHIPGAINLYFKTEFNEAGLAAVVTKDRAFVVYCQGPRCLLSSKACGKAVAWGFTKVYYFREGYPSWKAAGYPVAVP
ncbi:MAG: rhodanese-like domain-containing protein [Desulfobulbia bacterium]